MAVHVQIWTGSCNARITDMTNAGRRGKTCRVQRFSGTSPTYRCNEPQHTAASDETADILARLEAVPPDADFDRVVELLTNAVAAARDAGIAENWVKTCEDQPIRGVDAPKPELHAGNEKWRGWLDDHGVHLRDLTDRHNEPCECTHGQTGNQAYRLAAKVWEQVKTADTMYEAAKILTAAGCKLHFWCAVD